MPTIINVIAHCQLFYLMIIDIMYGIYLNKRESIDMDLIEVDTRGKNQV
jgi:hypothetical protein